MERKKTMASKKLFNLLRTPDKGVGRTYGPNGTLSRLFRQMLKDRNVGPERFGQLMADYLLNPRNRIPKNRKDMTSARGNLGMALSQKEMTWKVFCKGLAFFKIIKIDIAIRAYYANGQESIHSTTMVLHEPHAPTDSAEDPNNPSNDAADDADEESVNDEQ
jgi:hypothetical protein